ncbi:hypothetical protein GUJ93_ZPchr0011g27370 [Zizania palustris]|uniref:Uncharacterized protein n=1 Tax=Zizania palustris TaxID=103762 RepID=A0A8J6BMR4_ZIZPA|nr:hypothetical protein GUJ93_ZPchr0011g27370 [Zizania palustris]
MAPRYWMRSPESGKATAVAAALGSAGSDRRRSARRSAAHPRVSARLRPANQRAARRQPSVAVDSFRAAAHSRAAASLGLGGGRGTFF